MAVIRPFQPIFLLPPPHNSASTLNFHLTFSIAGFFRILQDSSGFFRILQDSSGFFRMLGDIVNDEFIAVNSVKGGWRGGGRETARSRAGQQVALAATN